MTVRTLEFVEMLFSWATLHYINYCQVGMVKNREL